MATNQKVPKTTYRDIASTRIIFCNEQDTVSIIAQKMAEFWVDTIFVKKDQGKVTGLITDGIIWNLIAKEDDPTDPRTLKAKDIMFEKFIRVNCDKSIESIDEVRKLLEKTKIQRICIVRDGEIVGLVRKKFIERVKRYSRSFTFELK
ncbi:MAG: CBS domain-containing protein [Candidatus Helarchaeota archaeon]|nr:CBS domain-containing protein [Candidatus Helarchaeota archaeon]